MLALLAVVEPVAADPSPSHSAGHRAKHRKTTENPDRPAKAETCDVPGAATFDTPLNRKPWMLQRIQPERAWPISRGRGVKVAVIDSGVSTDPEVLDDVVYPGRDYLADGNGTCDQYGHGTTVAAIIAGRDGTGSPYYGVAPDAEILPYRVLVNEQADDSGNTPTLIAKAIRQAVDDGAQVINMSLYTQPTDALKSAVSYALQHDVVLVAAAGNEGGTSAQGATTYPAALDGVIAVAGINAKGGHVSSSNTADYVQVAAPGDQIQGPAAAGGGYQVFRKGGTSFAAPFVSGEAALIRAYHPDMTAKQVRRRIRLTADHPPEGWNETVGYGVVNPYRALGAILKGEGPVPETSGHRAMPALPADDNPMRTVEIASAIVAAGLLVLALLVLIGRRVIPAGRQRAWRAGRADYSDPDTGPRPTPSTKPEPAGDRLSITAPSSRTNTPAGPGERTSALPPPTGRALPGSGRP